mmetsp:Transcript_29147/g.61982  ORF Transcript_29147/g.61982 Transcript_29147/m.61982 type:complete len:254 (-) Transcript_29147:120-881(-)|eukprot:CAMPEP_0172308244 /NCGR_PEP_ID=MMETSP1058-20130122/8908_1 /TAXON_ID=83371 /ORGANISM="Detonula confervacea, Strain CCMP 353" /LENGTH=253 /DNA_ID=CAMNT_0013020623 /DNA_START=76 /DNA_END=837 /DNA_ORIENTATION=-
MAKYEYSYYRDENFKDPSNTIVMLGVGTAMSNTDYSNLCEVIVRGTHVLAVVVDFNPRWIVKLDPDKFVEAANGIMAELQSLDLIGPAATLVVGGHSAGGYAAAASLNLTYNHGQPVGYFGIDPAPRGPFAATIDVPSFVVGLEVTTCGVDPMKSSRAAYSKSGAAHRTLVQIKNQKKEFHHCVFTDKGCLVVCPKDKSADSPIQGVAKAFSVFLDRLKSGNNADKKAYDDALGGAPMYVKAMNADEVENKAN